MAYCFSLVVKFIEPPELNQEKKCKDKFKIVSLKVKQGIDFTPELVLLCFLLTFNINLSEWSQNQNNSTQKKQTVLSDSALSFTVWWAKGVCCCRKGSSSGVFGSTKWITSEYCCAYKVFYTVMDECVIHWHVMFFNTNTHIDFHVEAQV